jgi:DNA invertase Pin-like site-specific DNA recombinase
MSEKKPLRCAVYTRKSSEEGLEQDFNSLEAQREACEAYVRSQANEGWMLIDDRFDDGGFSGGNIQRPGLEALMKMVRDGQVDVIVIYKIDRLTRSLTDFARLAETFDKHGVSFVSVTQQFNTTTSMGRLMLNVLLSFAQFEREITGERIRDKIAASKKKGMWMGGNPPMGFDVIDRKLVINAEAETVRRIFSLYLEEGTVPALLDRLATGDIRTTKRSIGSKGRTIGGKLFTRGHVYKLLTNPIYIGRISHKGSVHPGQHEAIIDLTTWAAVQQKLADNTQGARTRRRRAVQREYLLAGLLVSERGNRFVPMHAAKGSRRYRYYVEELPRSKADHGARLEAVRLPAPEIEAATVATIAGFLRDGGELMRQLADLSPDQARLAVRAASEVAGRVASRNSACDQVVKSLVKRVVFRRETLRVELNGSALRRALLGEQGTNNDPEGNRRDSDEPDVILSLPIALKRRGVQMKLVVDGDRTERAIDLPLVTAVSRAHWWAQMLMTGGASSIEEIAEREGVGATYVGQLLPLGFMAPALVERVVSGTHPAELTAGGLIWKTDVPLRWRG